MTFFEVATPAQPAAASPVGPSAPSRQDPLLHATVLIVDDVADNVALLEQFLRAAGVPSVHVETDPREVVARCLELEPDVVLLDLHMPHMDGYSVLRALAAAIPDATFLPVIAITADPTTATRDRALSEGAKDFLTKPFDMPEVVLRVRNLLETRDRYTCLQRRNESLQDDLARRQRAEKRQAAEHGQRLARIDDVLTSESIELVFQPIVDLDGGGTAGVEALSRFTAQPYRPPNVWFEEAATVGRGVELELLAVELALRHLPMLPTGAFLSVNVSPLTLQVPTLAGMLEALPGADRVVLELTEHAAVLDYPALQEVLADLRGLGVRVAVDDMGAGYAGLRHVLGLRPDIVKLDMALISGIDTDDAKSALVEAMVAFGRRIGAVLVAEGIETAAELRCLQQLGIPMGQGYHLARPVAIGELPSR